MDSVFLYFVVLILLLLSIAFVSFIYNKLNTTDFGGQGCNANIVQLNAYYKQIVIYILIALTLVTAIWIFIGIYNIFLSSSTRSRHYY